MNIAIIIGLSLLLIFFIYQYLKVKESDKNQADLKTHFKALSSEALAQNNQLFLDLARSELNKQQERAKFDLEKQKDSIDHLVGPMKEMLKNLEGNLQHFDKERKGQHEGLLVQLKNLAESERHLRQETSLLARALKSPTSRGQWGELQLKRVVELSGMVNHCDFFQQVHMNKEGQSIRPDMVVHLPGKRFVIIDSKTPLEFHLAAMEEEDPIKKKEKLTAHARCVKQHILSLGKKRYYEGFENCPEFVVLFFPSETFYSSALEVDPALIELGIDQNIILATPTTLIGLLRSIAYGWKQEALSQNAKEISELGGELYKRLSDMNGHFSKLGRALNTGVKSFNDAMGSYESRVLVSARKLHDLGAGSKKIDLERVELLERITKEK